MPWGFGHMNCYFILSHDTSDHFLNAKNSLRGDHPINHPTKLAVRSWKLEVGIISFCSEKWLSEIFSNSSRRLREHCFFCMHVQTDSACILVLDKQKWQCAGLTRFGVNMTALEMAENNCQNEGEIVPAWDGQWGSGYAVAATGPASVPVWCFCAGLFLWWGLTSPACFWRMMIRLQLQSFSRKMLLFLFDLRSVGWCAESDTIRLLWHQWLHVLSCLLLIGGGHMSTDTSEVTVLSVTSDRTDFQ